MLTILNASLLGINVALLIVNLITFGFFIQLYHGVQLREKELDEIRKRADKTTFEYISKVYNEPFSKTPFSESSTRADSAGNKIV